MVLIKNKSQVLSLTWTSAMQLCTLEVTWLERSFEEKNLGNPDGQHVGDGTAVCHWRMEELQTELHEQGTSRQNKRSDYSPLCNIFQATPGIPCPASNFPVDPDRPGQNRESSAKGY